MSIKHPWNIFMSFNSRHWSMAMKIKQHKNLSRQNAHIYGMTIQNGIHTKCMFRKNTTSLSRQCHISVCLKKAQIRPKRHDELRAINDFSKFKFEFWIYEVVKYCASIKWSHHPNYCLRKPLLPTDCDCSGSRLAVWVSSTIINGYSKQDTKIHTFRCNSQCSQMHRKNKKTRL